MLLQCVELCASTMKKCCQVLSEFRCRRRAGHICSVIYIHNRVLISCRGGDGPNPAVLVGAAVAVLAALYVGLNVAL